MYSSFTSLPAQKPWINYLKYSNSKDNQKEDLPDPAWFTIQAAFALSNPREKYWQEGNYLSQHNSGCMCVDWILHSNTSRDTWNFLRYHWICIFQQQQCKDIIYQANPTFGTRQGFWKKHQIRPLFVVNIMWPPQCKNVFGIYIYIYDRGWCGGYEFHLKSNMIVFLSLFQLL